MMNRAIAAWPAILSENVAGGVTTMHVLPGSANVEVVTVAGGHSVLWDDFDETATAVSAFVSKE